MLARGTTVAGYRIDGPLGEGGMGMVYRATQLSLNRSVALKILAPEFGNDAAFRERFRREGLLQAAIDHPHIVTVYDTGETEHGLYLVMRLIRGPTLKDMILSRELDPGRSLRLLAQVADALDTAHDAGLTHRDVKPQNILIGSRDHAYLADFGLTKAPDEAGRLTTTGQFVGTIDYVSPEQIQGESASHSSDVYALTGVLYECLVGAVPFPKPAEAAVVYAHISEPAPRPTVERPELPEAIDDVIAKGMAKSPEDRYASAGELLLAAGEAFGEAIGSVPGPLHTPEETGVRSNGTQTEPADTASSAVRNPAGETAESPIHRAPTSSGVVPGVPKAAPTEKAPTRSRRPTRILAAAAVAVAIAALLGFLLGDSGSDTEDEDLSKSASAGDVSVSFPGEWRRVAKEPRIPGLDFSHAMVMAPPDAGDARLVAGKIDGSSPSFLPKEFLERLPEAPPRDDPVKLGDLRAYRYAGLVPEGAAGRVTVYVAPTTEGVASVACLSAPELVTELAPDCDRVATTLEVAGAKPLPLD